MKKLMMFRNPYILIKGEQETDWADPGSPKKFRGNTRSIRELVVDDMATAHEIAKLAGVKSYMITDVEDVFGSRAVFKTPDIIEYEAKVVASREQRKFEDLATKERLEKSPKAFILRRYGKVTIYAQRSKKVSEGRDRPKVWASMYITRPGKSRKEIQFSNYFTKDGKFEKKKFLDDFVWWFGGKESQRAVRAKYDRYVHRTIPGRPAQLGVYPDPLPQIADELPQIVKELSGFKKVKWTNPIRRNVRNPRTRSSKTSLTPILAIGGLAALVWYMKNKEV